MRFKSELAWCLLALALVACRTKPPTAPAPSVASQGSVPAAAPALALETFDEVWKVLHETHFDTNFNGHDWLMVREKYRPRVQAATTQRDVRNAIEEMLKLLDVSHLALVPGDLADMDKQKGAPGQQLEEADAEETGTFGIHVRYLGTNLVVTAVEPGLPAAAAGVLPGWLLKTVAARSTAELWARLPATLDERRRGFLAWRAVSQRLSGPPDSEAELEFVTGERKTVTLKLRRRTAPGEAIQFGTLPVLYAHLVSTNLTADSLSIGLIRFNIWMLPTALAFHRAVDEHRQRDGIIIDLRGNIGGVVGMIMGVAGHFVTEQVTLGTLLARDNKLKLPAFPRFSDANGKAAEPFAGPVAVLVDEITVSASEVFAGGLQEQGRIRVFGRTTAGQALPAVFHRLPNGDLLYHPVADFVTPTGMRFESRGVVPDVVVPLDRAALLRGVDPAIEAARRWIATEVRK